MEALSIGCRNKRWSLIILLNFDFINWFSLNMPGRCTQKQENYAIVQSKILSAIFNSPTWLKGHFSESLWCYLSYLVRFLISTRNWQCHKGKHFHFLVKFYLKIKKWKCCPLWNCQLSIDVKKGKEREG